MSFFFLAIVFVLLFFMLYFCLGFLFACFAHYHTPVDFSNPYHIKVVKAFIAFWPYALIVYLFKSFKARQARHFEDKMAKGNLPVSVMLLKKMPTQQKIQARKKIKEINKTTEKMQALADITSEPVTSYGWD